MTLRRPGGSRIEALSCDIISLSPFLSGLIRSSTLAFEEVSLSYIKTFFFHIYLRYGWLLIIIILALIFLLALFKFKLNGNCYSHNSLGNLIFNLSILLFSKKKCVDLWYLEKKLHDSKIEFVCMYFMSISV